MIIVVVVVAASVTAAVLVRFDDFLVFALNSNYTFLFSTNRIGAHRSTSILTFLRTAARGNLDSSFLFNFVRRPTDELFKLLDSLFLDLPIEFLTTESL